MSVLDSEMKRLVERHKLGFVATVSEVGMIAFLALIGLHLVRMKSCSMLRSTLMS
jgi:hypothetical protein